ncbi:MAG: amidohydrolase family protein [Gemmatimonadetes bacterium]|nr:amidohydrolase family protein [Gemmatimonadota bacterium]MCC6770597.1 amidohydrolase family protein [Gemmatimonadaceae bacterium]
MRVVPNVLTLCAALLVPMLLASQQATPAGQPRTIAAAVRQFVSVDAPVVVLTHARVVDGTGRASRDDQTIVITGDRITAVGASGTVPVPVEAQVIDLTGHTVIPGIVGIHDHMYYSSVNGSLRPMLTSYPKLFLGAGITTIRTTGSADSYLELNLKGAIDRGELVGPNVVVTGPYLQGPIGSGVGIMHPLRGADDARRVVRYWAEEGVTWFKAYTTISRAELGAAIDEAHKRGVKVTAHLCSVGFREAVALGIDNLEHGFLTNTEWYPGKEKDKCPTASDSAVFAGLDVNGADVQRTIREMVAANVAMTSTLAVFELSSPSRVPRDQRVLDALHPDVAKVVGGWYDRAASQQDSVARQVFRKHMEFERAFATAGGMLAAGSDPCCLSAIAGYADQRNFELLVEAGFSPEQAVQVMTANGAKVLGLQDRIGTVAAGKQADLVVLKGDPTRTPGDIRNVVTVFRAGVGYDSAKLTASVKGMIGIK